MNRMKKVISIAAALLIVVFVTQATAYAQVGQDPKTNARHSRITGIWDVDVTLTDCATNATLFTFAGMHKFELGGTGQIVPNANTSGLSPHMMIWSHVSDNDYLVAAKMFRWNAAGVNIGWIVMNFEVSINEDADEYSGSGIAQVFDTAGVQIGANCPYLAGTRFTGEP
jgi:hypothetical protein